MATSSSHEPIAGPSTGQDLDMDYYPDVDVDVESDEESKYDYFHAGYDIHDPDIVRNLAYDRHRLCLTYKGTQRYSGLQCLSI